MGLPTNEDEEAILITWNRIGAADTWSSKFIRRGLPVLVVENATWGNSFAGERWYHIARHYHNTAGCFPIGDARRWSALSQPLAPWVPDGPGKLVLLQRGIGSAPTRMPPNFLAKAKKLYPGAKIRKHPGTSKKVLPLKQALAGVSEVVTWGSGAAIKALQMGIRVRSFMPRWIGEQDNTDAGRLAMFERLAWAQWTLKEIASGSPFDRLLAND